MRAITPTVMQLIPIAGERTLRCEGKARGSGQRARVMPVHYGIRRPTGPREGSPDRDEVMTSPAICFPIGSFGAPFEGDSPDPGPGRRPSPVRSLYAAGCRPRRRHTTRAKTRRLDLSQLRFIDVCGMRAVIRAVGTAHDRGTALQVDPRVSRCVARLIGLVGGEAGMWPPAGDTGRGRGRHRHASRRHATSRGCGCRADQPDAVRSS